MRLGPYPGPSVADAVLSHNRSWRRLPTFQPRMQTPDRQRGFPLADTLPGIARVQAQKQPQHKPAHLPQPRSDYSTTSQLTSRANTTFRIARLPCCSRPAQNSSAWRDWPRERHLQPASVGRLLEFLSALGVCFCRRSEFLSALGFFVVA